MSRHCLRLVFLAGISATLFGQTGQSGPRTIRIVLERLRSNAWKPVDPGLVLDRGDRVRFRMESNAKGYLYVLNYGSSGDYSLLFPSDKLGNDNRIEPGEVSHIPREQNVFRISGPAGQEVVYWILSPVTLPGYGPALPHAPRKSPALSPRCDDALFRARGECIDSTAGARGLDVDGDLPPRLKPPSRPSDIVVMREDNQSVVAAKDDSGAPIIYEFRISHH